MAPPEHHLATCAQAGHSRRGPPAASASGEAPAGPRPAPVGAPFGSLRAHAEPALDVGDGQRAGGQVASAPGAQGRSQSPPSGCVVNSGPFQASQDSMSKVSMSISSIGGQGRERPSQPIWSSAQ